MICSDDSAFHKAWGKEVLSTETEQRFWGDHVFWGETQPHNRAGEYTHTCLYSSLARSCLVHRHFYLENQLWSQFPHCVSNNVTNKKKSYFDDVWFSAKRRVKTAILSAALSMCFSLSQQFTGGNLKIPIPFLILAPVWGDRLCYLWTRASVGRQQGQVKVASCRLSSEHRPTLAPSPVPVKCQLK